MIYFFYLLFPQFWIIFVIFFFICRKMTSFLKKQRLSNIVSVCMAIFISSILIGPCIQLTEDIEYFFRYSKSLEKQKDYNYFINNGVNINKIYDDLEDNISLEFSGEPWGSVWETKRLQDKLNKKYEPLGIKIWFREAIWSDKKSFMIRVFSLEDEKKYIDMPIIITKDFLMKKGVVVE